METKTFPGAWYWTVLSLCLLVTLWSVVRPAGSNEEPGFVSSRKSVVINGVVPDSLTIPLGQPFGHTVYFDKIRDDCEDGRIVRHMWNVETGRVYLVEDRPTVRAEVGENIPIYLRTPTKPLRPEDNYLMGPGVWSIKTLITYRCPTPDGILVPRETSYSTPVFTVKG